MLQHTTEPTEPTAHTQPNTQEPIRAWVEALLFASEHPLSTQTLRTILSENFPKYQHLTKKIEKALASLQAQYNQPNRGVQLVEVAGGWQLRTHPDFGALIRRLLTQRQVRLSQAALECLAIVAYRQPITRSEVDAIRGVDCGGTMRTLLERGLLRVAGRHQSPGRPYLYATTNVFLEYFDLNDLSELPKLQQLLPPTPAQDEEDDN